jgi:hypothetical protein
MLGSLCHDLKGCFVPYLQESATLLLPLTRYGIDPDVAMMAISCLPDLVSAACAGALASPPQCDNATARSVFEEVTSHLMALIDLEKDTTLLAQLLAALQQCIATAPALAVASLGGEESMHAYGSKIMELLVSVIKCCLCFCLVCLFVLSFSID